MSSHGRQSPAALTGPLLRSVSRSFFLSLRVLPLAVRAPLGVSYLLARAADTIADADVLPANDRLALLAEFRSAIHGETPGDFLPRARAFGEAVTHAGERELLDRLSECLAAAAQLPPSLQIPVRAVLDRILRGQTLDLERFGRGAQSPLRCLPDAAALDEYTWLVAGCVGDFWTEVCALQMPGVFRKPVAAMKDLGIRYGRGLQLINILRDQPADAANGRCYLPASELRRAGLAGPLVWPADDWSVWHAVREPWIARAQSFLADGRRYVEATRPFRLRLATMLPLLIGEATLQLIEKQPTDAAPIAAKVPRRDVRRLFRRAVLCAFIRRIPAPP